MTNGTAIPTHELVNIGGGVYLSVPICRCFTAESGTSGVLYCPVHGQMLKRNGTIKKMPKSIEAQMELKGG